MLNRTLSVTNRQEINNTTNNTTNIKPDNKIIIKPEEDTYLKLVKTSSDQFEQFTSGDPYLLDEIIEQDGKYEVKMANGAHFRDNEYKVIKNINRYATQKVQIIEIQVDNDGNAYVTYKKVPGKPKYISRRQEVLVDPTVQTYSQAYDRADRLNNDNNL